MNWTIFWMVVSFVAIIALVKKDVEDRAVAHTIQRIIEGDDDLLKRLREKWNEERNGLHG